MKLKFNCWLALWLLGLIAAGSNFLFAQAAQTTPAKSANSNYKLTADDEIFLEDLEKRAFQYFWEHSDAKTGLTLDRARTNGDVYAANTNNYNVASSAATGFALTSYCIAAERNWRARPELIERTRRTLDFFQKRAFHKNGWFYHWLDQKSGARRWDSEVSSIDTALLLGGVLTVRGCFADDKQIVAAATKIYDRVDFAWMLAGDRFLLSHGWRPESGFLKARWDNYSEHSILYLLGIGSVTHPIPWQSWYAWKRDFAVTYGDYSYQASASPLFIHQFSHAWFDFRGKRERYQNFKVDYFENSATATRAQRQFFIDVLSKEFPEYSEKIWGLTASDSEKGYFAWGAPPRDAAIDGTVVPCAAGGSLMFAPEIALPALVEMKNRFGSKVYGRYGFTDAFNPHNGWTNPDVIGIDLGIMLLSAENLRTGNVWRWFMNNSEPQKALRKARLQ